MKTKRIKRSTYAVFKGIAAMCLMHLLLPAMPAYSQEETGSDLKQEKVKMGIYYGMSNSRIDLYYTSGSVGECRESLRSLGHHYGSTYAFQLNRSLELKVNLGVGKLTHTWTPGYVETPVVLDKYNIKSYFLELPVEVTFHPFRTGNLQPYLATGLAYRLDYASFTNNIDPAVIRQLNTNNVNYTCGLGLDWLMGKLRVGIELNAGFPIFSAGTGLGFDPDAIHFVEGPAFGICFNIRG